MIDTVLFDLGGTLVRYYERAEFPGILKQAILRAAACLPVGDRPAAAGDGIWQRVIAEDFEAGDHAVRPLEARLSRIFGLGGSARESGLLDRICRSFMEPIFALAAPYEDAVPALREMKRRGMKTAIVSNTPWGSPACLWREEVARHGLAEHVDALFFCRDVGWRKPARPIFEHALKRLETGPDRCLFVGDDPRWDVAGPAALGIAAVWIDRGPAPVRAGVLRIETLSQLVKCL